MTLLFINCQTSGLFKKGLALDDPNQPWVCSIAAELTNDSGDQLAAIRTGIRAGDRKVTEGAQKVHGISSQLASRTGVSELSALGVLCGRESFASQARYVVGHGLQFDKDVITSVLARNGRDAKTWVRAGLQFIDTMTAAAPFCKLKSEHESGAYRWPNLDEACKVLLGEEPRAGVHDAWNDLHRCKALFFHLRERGAFDLEEAA